MWKMQESIVSIAVGALSTVSSADAVFNIWVEAPDVVQAGSTFTVSVWGEVSGSILDESDGGFASFEMDLLASGAGAEFSTATFPFMNIPLDFGTPEPNALRRVLAANSPSTPFYFYDDNPLLLFYAEVTTAPDARGSLELTVAQVGVSGMLSWWVDYGTPSFVVDTDPGSTRIITPAVVNVVPSPGWAGLLALARIAANRRRR